MPRDYVPKGARSGRPPLDDGAIARGVLFTERWEKREKHEARGAAARLLIERRLATRAATSGRPVPPMSGDSAHRRVNEIVEGELRAQGETPLTGLPPSVRKLGEETARIGRERGYAAGRAALVELIALRIAEGRVWEVELMKQSREIAKAWVAEHEAASGPRGNSPGTT